MKKLIYFVLLLLTVLLIPSCEDEEVEIPKENGSVVFSFKSEEPSVISDKAGSLKSSLAQKGIEDAEAILISIETAEGISLYQQHRMDLINVNGHYLTSPISLSPGNYSITEFIVIDESNNAIYITPQEGSAYAAFVNNPLPVSFTVTTNLVENVNLEVIGTENATPEDFGYVSFSFTIVGDGTFGVSASVYNSAIPGMELTEATMVLSADGTELLTETLGAETNFFPIPGSFTTYTIEISKEGYTTVTKDFTRTELNALGNNPYNAVLLNPDGVGSFTFVTDQTEELNTVKLRMEDNTNSEFLIDWGDGSTDVYKAGGNLLEHEYTDLIEYTVTVTGNIEMIRFLSIENNGLIGLDISKLIFLKSIHVINSQLTNIDLSSNLELTVVSLRNNQLKNIDLSSNPLLKQVILDNNELTSIDLSSNQELTAVWLGENQLTSIDVTSNPLIIQLLLAGNELTSIDLSSNPEITDLMIRDNQLTSIDVSSNPLLTDLDLANNELTSIDLSSNPAITELWLYENQLTSIDLSYHSELKRVLLYNNQLSTLDVSNNHNMTSLSISNNQINDVADMELIYNQLLVNVRANNIVEGGISSRGNVTASQAIIDIANELTNDYNWSVSY